MSFMLCSPCVRRPLSGRTPRTPHYSTPETIVKPLALSSVSTYRWSSSLAIACPLPVESLGNTIREPDGFMKKLIAIILLTLTCTTVQAGQAAFRTKFNRELIKTLRSIGDATPYRRYYLHTGKGELLGHGCRSPLFGWRLCAPKKEKSR